LAPVLLAHHHVEDKIIFPFYLSLGVLAPDRQSEDHIALVNRINKLDRLINRLLKRMNSLLLSNHIEEKDALKFEENQIKEQFHELMTHCQDHFTEEELYWPAILRQCGQGNWSKIEPLVIDYTLKFGEFNAGDPYRLMLCGIARAMGIQIGNDIFRKNNNNIIEETRWASKTLQERYISSRPTMIRNRHIKNI
jgi:hypothetical protein